MLLRSSIRNGPRTRSCTSGKISSLSAFDHSPVLILEIATEDDDPIDEDPNAKTAQRENHSDSGPCFADIEPVNAKNAQEPAKQKGSQPVLVAHSGVIVNKWIGTGQGTSALSVPPGTERPSFEYQRFQRTERLILHRRRETQKECVFAVECSEFGKRDGQFSGNTGHIRRQVQGSEDFAAL